MKCSRRGRGTGMALAELQDADIASRLGKRVKSARRNLWPLLVGRSASDTGPAPRYPDDRDYDR